ncbi:hypothetical protein PM8797T_31418 [Gimesia maris DSM 8797]|nr:hypothetical protein PM8797T_31418 [Gimesia maris DSM 8797]
MTIWKPGPGQGASEEQPSICSTVAFALMRTLKRE